jgi:class 3 adenylate cyclase
MCRRCDQQNPEGATYCNACGAVLAELARTGEERRIVSVLFVDLEGFTSRAEMLDPEDVREILTPYHDRVRIEVERFGGIVEKFIGDAVMGIFGAPTAYGDDPERAVRAALAIRDWAGEDGLRLRIAVNTGEAIVTLGASPSHGEAMVAGDVVNTAARLQAAAPVGAALVGEETFLCTRGQIEYRPAPPVRAKGKATPVNAWLALTVKSQPGVRPQLSHPMFGRESELAVLTRIWNRVADERRPHLVTVFGPSGIGKSRLALEFSQHVALSEGRVIQGRSTPYGASSPYSAFAQHVKQVAGVFDSDQLRDAQAKLHAAVNDLVGSAGADEHYAHLSMLVGLGEEGDVSDRETLFFSARVFVESLAEGEPTLLIFDDIHWADGSLLDLIETLSLRVRDVPVLFLALARPEMLTDRPSWGGGIPAYTAVPLEPLSNDAARQLAGRLLAPGAEAPDPRTALVVQTAEGNPLFIEELAHALAERAATEATDLPTSVRAIVAARLDALPPGERSVLVDAAVVGRVFWRGVLARMYENSELSALLGSLEERDLIRREAVSRIVGEQQFTFKHALIRDVAYQSLPRTARRERHGVVANYLEDTTGAVGQSYEALAHHWREAGETQRSVEYLIAAAEQAGRGWAKERAITLYREALELLPEDDHDSRRRIMLRQAVMIQALFQTPDAQNLHPT